jgi:hypothetical protein
LLVFSFQFSGKREEVRYLTTDYADFTDSIKMGEEEFRCFGEEIKVGRMSLGGSLFYYWFTEIPKHRRFNACGGEA